MPSFTTTAVKLVKISSFTFELIQIQMPPFSTTVINGNSNAAVVVIGFCINQLSAFPLPALRPILRNILDAAMILFYFFPKQCISVQNSTKNPRHLMKQLKGLAFIAKVTSQIRQNPHVMKGMPQTGSNGLVQWAKQASFAQFFKSRAYGIRCCQNAFFFIGSISGIADIGHSSVVTSRPKWRILGPWAEAKQNLYHQLLLDKWTISQKYESSLIKKCV